MQQTFKYYRRGQGELDTSNFTDLVKQGHITVETLDEKTFMSLLALHTYWSYNSDWDTFSKPSPFTVNVVGYVAHLRSDKDTYSPFELYEDFLPEMSFVCDSVQHEDTYSIKGAKITKRDICDDLGISLAFATFYGADGSVPKFFPEVDKCATKVRVDGKVTGMEFDYKVSDLQSRIVIVDDILGGGATIQKHIDIIREKGFKGEIWLWVAYNEGIHTEEFLGQFTGTFLGDLI